MKRSSLLALAGLVTVSVLTGCGGSSANSGNSGNSGSTAAPAEAAAASEAGSAAVSTAASAAESTASSAGESAAASAAESAAASAAESAAASAAESTAASTAESAAASTAEGAALAQNAQEEFDLEAGKALAETDVTLTGSGKVIVYNWGEYIDPEVLEQFEEETGITVVYEEFETNEIMYPKISTGAVAYDVVCPSDYMIDKMIRNDLLQPINKENVPNLKNIGASYMKWSEEFDPGNQYSVPYCWGTVGILYNKTMVEDPVDSWEILWNEKYKDNILMQDSVRDAMMVAEKRLGYSINTVDEKELEDCTNLLIQQKPLVQAYVVDQVRDKMIGDEAALGVIYSGEAIYTQRENENLEYVIPREGSNIWIDSWVIPKNAPNKENAEIFINYMCRADIALKNFDYITYSTPNVAARALIEDEEIRNSTIAFPTEEMTANCETFRYLGDEGDNLYADNWNRLKSS